MKETFTALAYAAVIIFVSAGIGWHCGARYERHATFENICLSWVDVQDYTPFQDGSGAVMVASCSSRTDGVTAIGHIQNCNRDGRCLVFARPEQIPTNYIHPEERR